MVLEPVATCRVDNGQIMLLEGSLGLKNIKNSLPNRNRHFPEPNYPILSFCLASKNKFRDWPKSAYLVPNPHCNAVEMPQAKKLRAKSSFQH